MEDAQAVLRGHRERRADGDGLLAVAVVERAGHLALAVEVHRALLDAAHQQHVAQEGGAVVERQVLGYGGGVVRPLRPGGAHGHPGLVSLCGRGPGGIAARGPACRAAAGVSAPYDAPLTGAELYRRAGIAEPVIYAGLRMRERVWWTRLRWRLRGATMWPAFVRRARRSTPCCCARCRSRATPPRTSSPRRCSASSSTSSRSRSARRCSGGSCAGGGRRLPKVVADDRAGTALIAGVSAVLLVGRPRPPPRRCSARRGRSTRRPRRCALVRPCGGAGTLPRARRPDGHVEAGTGPLSNMRPRTE